MTRIGNNGFRTVAEGRNFMGKAKDDLTGAVEGNGDVPPGETKVVSEEEEYRPGELLVGIRGDLPLEAALSEVASKPLQVLEVFDLAKNANAVGNATKAERIVHVKLPEGMSVKDASKRIEQKPGVVYTEPNYIYTLEDVGQPVEVPKRELASRGEKIPNDFDAKKLWGLRAISAPEAWSITTGTRKGPVVAVLDTGADLEHPDLKNNLWTNPGEIPGNGVDDDGNGVVDDVHGYNALEQTGDPSDDHYHGTHVAGTIAAEGNNGIGVVGVNWQAQVMPIKIFNSKGRTDGATILRGIEYAKKMGATITSNSWGSYRYDQALRDAFASFPSALHVFAAGNNHNDNDKRPHYPSSYPLPNILAVGATDPKDRLARFSNYGATTVDVGAPGVAILSTFPQGRYRAISGTSMAAPHVSGAAALVAGEHPEYDPVTLKQRLIETVTPLEDLEGKTVSGGIINVASALEDDLVPPDRVRGFSASAASPSKVVLRWQATGDDGRQGRAQRYDVRWSLRPIGEGTGMVPFEEAERVTGTPAPEPAGSRQEMTVDFFPSERERKVYFAIKAYDNAGHPSPVSTTQVQLPKARFLFRDEGAGDWTAEGKWARVTTSDGKRVWSDSPDGPYGRYVSQGLYTRPFSLKGAKHPKLVFKARHDLEYPWDGVWVQVSDDGGHTWLPIAPVTPEKESDAWISGRTDGWKYYHFSLDKYKGDTVQIRFQMETDGTKFGDGIELYQVGVIDDSK